MASPFTLSSITALALVGTGFGLYLGKSAIAEVNPAHFSSAYPETRFHSDLVPNRPDWGSPPAAFQNAALTSGYGTGCVACRTYPEEYFPVPDPAVEDPSVDGQSVDGAFEAATDRIIEEAELQIAEIARRSERSSVERYAHYPVSSEEGPARLVQAQAEFSQEGRAADCTIESQCEGESAPGI